MSAGRAHRDPAGWFVRRAGLARFTTFACALGLSLSAVTGVKPTLALVGLMVALAGMLASLASRRARPASMTGSALLVVSMLLVGLFAGYLGGTVRVAALVGGDLQSRIGSTVEAELVITGQVRASSGWQSATAVVRSLGGVGADASAQSSAGGKAAAQRGGLPGVGETVLLEVAPDDETAATGGASQTAGASQAAAASTPVLGQGLIVAFRGTIGAPEGPSDSGFDQARQLLHQGIEVVFRPDGAGSLVVLGRRGGVSGWFDRLRSSARAHLNLGPDQRVNEVLQGVVMGDTAGIDQAWMNAFRRSGTAHMLSVSGLHVASIAAIMIGLARLVGAARWVGFLLAAVSALLMIPFVGASPPIIRSAVMIVVVLTGHWVGRGRDQWQVLALAAAVVLALNPFAVYDVGFQLSFAAFAGMLALTGPVRRLLRRLPRALAENMAVSIAASVGTAPVSLAVFDRTSLVSPLANLLVVPLLPFVTGLGMGAVFLGFLWSGLSAGLAALASIPMAWTIMVSRLLAMAPVLSAADLGRGLFTLGVGLVALPAALALAGCPVKVPFGLPLPLFRRSLAWLRAHRPRGRRCALALSGAVLTFGLLSGCAVYPSLVRGAEALERLAPGKGWPDRVEVRVLDVGQGNAVLVRAPGHHALLFDGGPEGCDLAGQLHALGVRRLDLVVVSHPHADHFAGLLEALDGLDADVLIDQVQVVSQVQAVSGAGRPSSSEWGGTIGIGEKAASGGEEATEYLELRRQLADDGCRHVLAGTGYSVTVGDVLVRFFAPADPIVLVEGEDPWAARDGPPSGDELNGASLVAVVSSGSIDMLIPGDAEAEVLRRYELPPAEMVVVPHHGSRGAVSDALLAKLRAKAAFISVGKDNSFGHPYGGTVSALEEAVGTVLRTDTAGWVSCRVNGEEMVITTERTPKR